MKLERAISWFDKKTELLVAERNIDSIDLEVLKEIFVPAADDPLMYSPYDITEDKAEKLKNYVDLIFEFDKYFYQVECFQA